MQADLWKALLRRVPPEQIDNLMLMTAQGTEINVQMLLRMEEHWMVLRGRIAGSNDAGRVFCLPYEHLDHVGFQRPLSDVQAQAFCDGAPAPAAPAQAPPEPAAVAEPPAAPDPTPAAPAAPSAAPANPPAGLLARVPSRSDIIKRLRQRTEAAATAAATPKP
jgi:hypothetical protein